MIFSDEHFAKIRDYDFFKKDKFDALNTGLRTIKALGEYKQEIPFVSIIITTYKRPVLLREAINSVLRQDYDDYEIIVIDNECADIAEETDTQKLIRELGNSSIIYFRNIDPMLARMDRGASLARGEWICFLHDDDMLAANHLKTMTSIVKAHTEINYLSCAFRLFNDKNWEQIIENEFIANNRHDGYCIESCLQECVFFEQGSWMGALIKRQMYIDMGGMPQISTGCCDNIMSGKFIYLYGGFYRTQVPLYLYRYSNEQISADSDSRFNTLVSFYFYSRYALKKLPDLPIFDYERLCFAVVHQWMINAKVNYVLNFSLEDLALKCGVKKIKNYSDESKGAFYAWEEYKREYMKKMNHTRFEIYLDKEARVPYQ